jgi:DNA helicase IV
VRLPAFEDLSKEQDLIYNLELDGNYLVSGPPGTGKSVMALYRAQVLTFDDREPDVLMYSNVLRQYTASAAAEVGIEGRVSTFHSWFNAFWQKHYGKKPPTHAGDSYSYDWEEVPQQFLKKMPDIGSLHDLLVDEGQDLPLGFYRMTRLLAKNITVFADENQQLFEQNTTLKEIATAIAADECLALKRNYRNSAEIAAVARAYYEGAPTGVPDPPTRHGDKPTLRRYEQTEDFVDFVGRYASGRTNLNIGIACPDAATQKRLLRLLEAKKLAIPVQAYISSDRSRKVLDFEKPAITLVHYRSLKGLEFDTLFVPELQRAPVDATSASLRMMFYVVMSRARDELHLSWSGASDVPPIVAHLGESVSRR